MTSRAIESALADLATSSDGCTEAEYDRICGPTLRERALAAAAHAAAPTATSTSTVDWTTTEDM